MRTVSVRWPFVRKTWRLVCIVLFYLFYLFYWNTNVYNLVHVSIFYCSFAYFTMLYYLLMLCSLEWDIVGLLNLAMCRLRGIWEMTVVAYLKVRAKHLLKRDWRKQNMCQEGFELVSQMQSLCLQPWYFLVVQLWYEYCIYCGLSVPVLTTRSAAEVG